ncbi:MAG: zinc-ribbon domain-containing transport protein [Lachnospiraceae bacterium]|nr:zinc-ribbon domain-containing transport protein [Lachnospiraceae bacterium]
MDKKKKRNFKRTFLIIMLLSLLCFSGLNMFAPLEARADFGDFSGDTDYGSDDSGGWDSGGSDDNWSSDDDRDRSYYYSGGSGGSSSGDGGGFSSIGTVIGFLVVAYIVASTLAKLKKSSGPREQGAAETSQNMLKPMSDYLSLDPNFNEAEFREKLSNLYIKMQECWHDRDIESLKPYFTDAFYNQSNKQIEQKKRLKQTPCTERVAVLEVTPRGYYQASGMDHIVVRVRSRFIAYTLDDESGNVISGSKTNEKFLTYEWDVSRKSGIQTEERAEMRKISCPSCGAPVDINQTAKCPYCGSVINVDNEDWALNGIKGISQQTR